MVKNNVLKILFRFEVFRWQVPAGWIWYVDVWILHVWVEVKNCPWDTKIFYLWTPFFYVS